MPRIIISCPVTGQDVPTGHRTQDIDLSSMTEARSFRCPVCHEVHAWQGREARIEFDETTPAAHPADLTGLGAD